MPDLYLVRARWFPAVIAAAPAIAFAAIFVSWGSLGVIHLVATSALGVLLIVFADVARRRGKAIEPLLIEEMNGWPSIAMLRHRDTTFDAPTKARFHSFLSRKLNETAPSREDEERDAGAADLYYERGAAWLRENTRDTKKFNVLFNENVTYGFRRNLFGLRVPGFLLNAAIVLGCAGIFWSRWPVDLSNSFNDKLLAVIVIALLHALYLFAFVNKDGVIQAAWLYARQLLLASEAPSLNKTAPTAPPRSRTKKPD